MKTSRKTYINIALALVILVAVGLGFYYFYKESADQKSIIQSQQKAINESKSEIDALKSKEPTDPSSLQVSQTYVAERIALLHCLQVKETPDKIKSLYNDSVFDPSFEGSGVFVTANGEIISNAHVVGIASLCLVQTAKAPNFTVPSPTYYAQVVSVDTERDIALLRVESSVGDEPKPETFSFFPMLKKEAQLGDKIFIAGFSAASNRRLAITDGIVSGREDVSGYIPGIFLITSAKIDAGNSGGAAITPQGLLIGLPTYLRGEYETLGYVLDLLRVSKVILNE